MKLPLVSVMTPCFNSARFIESCIESVLAQDYARVEHIIQDGASKDGTVDILRRYTGRVDWVSEPDQSQVDGLDRALKRSRGKFLLVLNADDMLLPNAASWAVEQMAKYPDAAVIYGDLYLMDEDGGVTQEFIGPDYDFVQVFCVEAVIPAQAAFIRRSALEQVGLGADLTLETCPDYEMFVRLGLQFPMRHVRGFVSRYRYYHRPMDGAQPRSVDRFVRSKSSVMQRVFSAADTPGEIRKLERRAKAGLCLWAAEEARGMGQLRAAWKYYGSALAELSFLGRILAAIINVYVALKPKPRVKPTRVARSPNLQRTLFVGAGLAHDTPEIAWLVRALRGIWDAPGLVLRGTKSVLKKTVALSKSAILVLAVVLEILTSLAILAALVYLIRLLLR